MSDSPLVWKTNFLVDHVRLVAEVQSVIEKVGFHPSTNQIGLTHTSDCPVDVNRYFQSVGSLYDYDLEQFRHQERDFDVFNKELSGTYLEWIYNNVPFRVARMRLMKMPPRKCLSIHEDTGPRYHFAIKTNPNSFLFFPTEKQSFQIPADGFLYGMNAEKSHTAFNADLDSDRIHLVFSDYEHS